MCTNVQTMKASDGFSKCGLLWAHFKFDFFLSYTGSTLAKVSSQKLGFASLNTVFLKFPLIKSKIFP